MYTIVVQLTPTSFPYSFGPIEDRSEAYQAQAVIRDWLAPRYSEGVANVLGMITLDALDSILEGSTV